MIDRNHSWDDRWFGTFISCRYCKEIILPYFYL